MAEPISHHNLEPEKHTTTDHDHLPRLARYRTDYDDGTSAETQHVLYWAGTVTQSMEAADWLAQRGPLPADPTQAESDAAILARQQEAQQAAQEAAALRQQILTTLQTAVGVPFKDLTLVQLKAVVAALAWQADALRADTSLRPPVECLDRRR